MTIRTIGLLALIVLTSGACASMGMGSIGDVLGQMGGIPGLGDQVRGQIDRVDTRARRIEVRSDNGQWARLVYDSRTDVSRGNERISASRLRSGDRITARVQRDRGGDLYAHQIYVDDYRDGGGGTVQNGRVERFDGQVSWVDTRTGRFELVTGRERMLVVLPYNPGNSTADRFRRLREGNRVRIEGERIGSGRVELRRFL